MERRVHLIYEELSWEELSPADSALVEAARTAASQAYAPYSGFPVGAAVRLRDGRLFTANNQENAAFPSGLCAERVLLFYLGSQGLLPQVQALAVLAPHSPAPVMPCGACRQVLHEYERLGQTSWVYIFAGAAPLVYRFSGIENLLPFAFVWKPSSAQM